MCYLLEKNPKPSCFHLALLISYTDYKGLLLKNRHPSATHKVGVIPQLHLAKENPLIPVSIGRMLHSPYRADWGTPQHLGVRSGTGGEMKGLVHSLNLYIYIYI